MTISKAQPFPASKIKVGAVLYLADAYTDDNGKTTSEVQEWHIRSIKAIRGSKTKLGMKSLGADLAPQYVNMTRKCDLVTWGKLSSKTGDYGWLKSIPSWCTKQFKVGADLPTGFYTTHRAALVYAVAKKEASIARCQKCQAEETSPSQIAGWQKDIDDEQAQLSALKRRLNALKSK